jgi:hypothetical protein
MDREENCCSHFFSQRYEQSQMQWENRIVTAQAKSKMLCYEGKYVVNVLTGHEAQINVVQQNHLCLKETHTHTQEATALNRGKRRI